MTNIPIEFGSQHWLILSDFYRLCPISGSRSIVRRTPWRGCLLGLTATPSALAAIGHGSCPGSFYGIPLVSLRKVHALRTGVCAFMRSRRLERSQLQQVLVPKCHSHGLGSSKWGTSEPQSLAFRWIKIRRWLLLG